jgi:hypothetical protein
LSHHNTIGHISGDSQIFVGVDILMFTIPAFDSSTTAQLCDISLAVLSSFVISSCSTSFGRGSNSTSLAHSFGAFFTSSKTIFLSVFTTGSIFCCFKILSSLLSEEMRAV